MKRILLLAAALFLLIGGGARAETVKVGITRLTGYAPVPVALARGYFKAEGIELDLVYSDSAEPIAVGVASGSLDFGVSGMSAGFYALASHGALRLLASAGGDHSGGFHGLVYLASPKAYAAGLTSPKDFAGHSVAVTQVGTSLEYSLALAARKYGYPMSAVTVRPLQSNTNVIAALTGSMVDGAVMPASPALGPLAAGRIKLAGWVGDVSGDSTSLSALFTGTKTADTKGDLVRRFLVAYRHGMRDLHTAFTSRDDTLRFGPDAPALLTILAQFTGVPPDGLKKAMPYFDAEGRLSAAEISQQIAWYRSQNLLKGDVKAQDLIDGRYALPLVANR